LDSDALDRANRRVAWLVALGGLLGILGQALPDFLAQREMFPLWWNAAGIATALAVIVLAAVGLWLPQRVLRAMWVAIPSAAIALQLLSYAVYRGPELGVAPWVWRLDPAALTLLVFVTRPAVAVMATIFAGASVAISAWFFTGVVPEVVAWNTPFHMSEIGFVVIFLGIRNRVVALNRTERAARLAAEQGAVRKAEAERHAVHARLVHDEVLSVLNAARMFTGDPPEVLRREARQALRAIDAAVVGSAAAVDTAVSPSEAVDQLRLRLADLVQTVEVTTADDRGVPASVIDAVASAALEAARNARRHAEARRVSATVWVGEGGIRVSVEDDGTGFAPDQVPPGRWGIARSIVARLHEVGGRAEITSSQGIGTRVLLSWRPAEN
jgi:signal transduction histidine kinase